MSRPKKGTGRKFREAGDELEAAYLRAYGEPPAVDEKMDWSWSYFQLRSFEDLQERAAA